MGRCASHHRGGADAQHLRPSPRIQTEMTMNDMTRVDQGVRIDVRNLNFFYGKTRALKDITVPLHDRKVTAFIGPSGCGKSTLLRVLNRIYDLYPNQRAEGQVLLDGMNILDRGMDINRRRASVGSVFQKPTPFPMSIRDNIVFGIRLHEQLNRREMDERIEWALQ